MFLKLKSTLYKKQKKQGDTFKVKGEKMNYTRFSRTGKEQQTLLFFERSRGNSLGEIPPVFSILAIPISYTIHTMKKSGDYGL